LKEETLRSNEILIKNASCQQLKEVSYRIWEFKALRWFLTSCHIMNWRWSDQ